MELSCIINGQAVMVWQPDALLLEAHPLGFRPDAHNPVWAAKHPTQEGTICQIWRCERTGRLHLQEAIVYELRPGVVTRSAISRFNAWCYSKEQWNQLLQLLRWA